MKLTTAIWFVFALCLLLVLAAMGWLSATALKSDRAEVEARRQAALEERVRLALWRMDSALAPTVAQESARPYFAYLPYFPAERSFNRMFNARSKGETLVASPLLVETPPRILLHFQFDAAGNLTSPQVPPEVNRKLEHMLTLDPAVQQVRAKQFARLRKLITLEKITALLPSPKPVELRVVGSIAGANDVQRNKAPATDRQEWQGAYVPSGGQRLPQPGRYETAQEAKPAQPMDSFNAGMAGKAEFQQNKIGPQQLEQSRREYEQRAQVVQQSANAMAMNQAANLPSRYYLWDKTAADLSRGSPKKEADDSPQPNTDINGVLMTPLWIDGQLILARRVLVAGQQYVQGCLLDWPDIRQWLKGEIADLLPDAQLAPAGVSDTAEESRLLAALPIRLVPGAVAVDGENGWSPLAISLLAAWVCLLTTAAAIVGLLTGVMRLSAAGVVRHGRHARAAHAADDLPDVRRNARRGDGARGAAAEGISADAPRRGGAADAFGGKRLGLRAAGARAIGPPAGNRRAERFDGRDAKPPGRPGGAGGDGTPRGSR